MGLLSSLVIQRMLGSSILVGLHPDNRRKIDLVGIRREVFMTEFMIFSRNNTPPPVFAVFIDKEVHDLAKKPAVFYS
jgi:hypothetical protein